MPPRPDHHLALPAAPPTMLKGMADFGECNETPGCDQDRVSLRNGSGTVHLRARSPSSSNLTSSRCSTALALPAPLYRGLSSCKSLSYGQNATSAAAGPGSNAKTLSMVVCDRRVAKLYAPCFECRRCLGLGYASQRELSLRRAGRRAQKIKTRLGGSNDPLEPFPKKPRGMHWRTYRRLRNEAKAAKAEADYLLAESLPGLAQLLDLVPPRQKRQLRAP
jgi:hypothetical protein